MTDLNVVVCLAFDHRAVADGLRKFKSSIFACPCVESVLEVSGTFDLIVHARLQSVTAYTETMARLAEPLGEFVSRIEANFVGRTVDCRATDERRLLWVPCPGGRRQVEASSIDKVIAEGDYMRLFVGDWHCLLHETIGKLHERLGPGFIQLHRSSLVRIDFIDRVLHQDHRWIARLRDGSQQPVAKSHVAEVVRLISGESAKIGRRSSKSAAARRKMESC